MERKTALLFQYLELKDEQLARDFESLVARYMLMLLKPEIDENYVNDILRIENNPELQNMSPHEILAKLQQDIEEAIAILKEQNDTLRGI